MSNFNKRKIFLQKSKRERRRVTLTVKNLIKENKETYSDKFVTDIFFAPDKNKKTHFLDLLFLSKKDPSIFWNVELFTVYEILRDNLKFEKEDPYNIKEEFYIHKNYKYGVGLTIIVNEKELNKETIHKTIERFYDLGEKNWISDKPVDKELLIKFNNEVT